MSYFVTIHKRKISDHAIRWSNVYRLDASSLDVALTRGNTIANAELNLLWDNYELYRIHAETVTLGVGKTLNVVAPGLRDSADPDVQLPLFNTVRVDFSGPSGRPSIKYLRLPLIEAEVTGFNLDPTFKTLVEDTYADLVLGLGYVLNGQGETIDSYVVNDAVQMRQQGWHRRTRPGFHRGYVAN
jgi:hypothetical protein